MENTEVQRAVSEVKWYHGVQMWQWGAALLVVVVFLLVALDAFSVVNLWGEPMKVGRYNCSESYMPRKKQNSKIQEEYMSRKK